MIGEIVGLFAFTKERVMRLSVDPTGYKAVRPGNEGI